MMSARTREEVNNTNAQVANNLLKFIAQIPHKGDNRDTPVLLTKPSWSECQAIAPHFLEGTDFSTKTAKNLKHPTGLPERPTRLTVIRIRDCQWSVRNTNTTPGVFS
jgi:hypothetical protein